MRGLSEPNGSWKMNCSLVRKRSRSLPSSDSTSILRPQSSNTTRPAPYWASPSLGSAEMPRMRILLSVVLPQPDSPTRPRHSLRSTSKLTSLTARTVRVVPPPAGRHVEARHGMQQRLEIGMLRIAEDVVQVTRFDDLAAIHHDDVVGDVGHNAEIVGDHPKRHAELGLKGID